MLKMLYKINLFTKLPAGFLVVGLTVVFGVVGFGFGVVGLNVVFGVVGFGFRVVASKSIIRKIIFKVLMYII